MAHIKKLIYVISVAQTLSVGRGLKKKDKVVIFSDSVNVINVKVCIAVVLNKFGQRVPFQRPWPHFKVIAALQS